MPDDERWKREIDWVRQELARNVDRLEASIQRCITESMYLQAQRQNGERVEELRERIVSIETERKNELLERQRERAQIRITLGAAALTLLTSIGLELVRVVGH